eukprot:3017971-Prorocentrum_lima.AAC.1
MTSSLVGSEMCIRDRVEIVVLDLEAVQAEPLDYSSYIAEDVAQTRTILCLLYTSDAADDM